MKRWSEEVPSIYLPDWEAVVIVAEYTTSDGPYSDDHFLVLIERDGEEFEYATDVARSIAPHVERIMSAPIKYGLANVTTEASRIIFPSFLQEKPLYEWATNTPTNILGHIFHFLTLGFFIYRKAEWTLEVRRYLHDLQSPTPKPPITPTDVLSKRRSEADK